MFSYWEADGCVAETGGSKQCVCVEASESCFVRLQQKDLKTKKYSAKRIIKLNNEFSVMSVNATVAVLGDATKYTLS